MDVILLLNIYIHISVSINLSVKKRLETLERWCNFLYYLGQVESVRIRCSSTLKQLHWGLKGAREC